MTESVSIVVPFRPDGAERERNWRWLRNRYRQLYPDWEIVEEPGPQGPWRKGAAVNAAARRATGDTLIVADADVLVAPQVLRDAVATLRNAPWVIPHGFVYRLNDHATEAVLASGPADVPETRRTDLRRGRRRGPAGGGISVARHEDFDAVGGIDECFEGWGGEDISFARALDTLVGDHQRLGEPMWHLDHPPMERRPGNRASPESEALAARYLEANRDSAAMAALCSERPYKGLEGGGIVALRRGVAHTIPLDERFVGWG